MSDSVRYKIGDVAKILGISPDLLRYYEKKGVVKPVKDQANDYRYYEPWDINFLIDCLWYKNFGFGIEQVAQIVSRSGYDDILSMMEDKETELEATIRRQEMLLRRSKEHLQEIARARTLLGKCDLVYSPEIVRYLNRYNFTTTTAGSCKPSPTNGCNICPLPTAVLRLARRIWKIRPTTTPGAFL